MNQEYSRLTNILGQYEYTYLQLQGGDTIARLENAEHNAHSRAREFLSRSFGELANSITLELIEYTMNNTVNSAQLELAFHYNIHLSGSALRAEQLTNNTKIPSLLLAVEVVGEKISGQFLETEDLTMINPFLAARIIDKALKKR